MRSKDEIIRFRISKAAITLKEAELMLKNGFEDAAVNRIYYACFYAVSGLLHKADMSAATHKGLRQLFGLHFVHTGLVSAANGKFFTEIFDRRNHSDYSDFVVFKENDVQTFLKKAKEFVEEIVVLIDKM